MRTIVQCWFLMCLICLALKVDTVQAQCSKPTGNPNTFISGDDINKDTFPEDSIVTFQCDIGYEGSGSGRTTCTNGQWSRLRLQCEKRSCGFPGEVINGRFDTSQGFEFGATVVAICNTGYNLVGSGERHCMATGWSDRIPVCEVVKCGSPPVIENGELLFPPEETYDYGQVVQYQCNGEYTLVGEESLSCSENEEFQPAAPRCEIVICPTPIIENAKQIGGTQPPFKYKNFVKYECLPKYVMDGEASLTCLITSNWSAEYPTCKALPTTTKPTTTTTTTPATTKSVNQGGDRPSPGPPQPPSPNNNGGIIAGSIVGAIALVGLICVGLFFSKKRSRGAYSGNVATNNYEEEL